jgi:hypothetical protein
VVAERDALRAELEEARQQLAALTARVRRARRGRARACGREGGHARVRVCMQPTHMCGLTACRLHAPPTPNTQVQELEEPQG